MLLQFLATLLGLVFGWFLWLRKALVSQKRLKKGETDNVIFQMHVLQPVSGTRGDVVLLFRNVVANTTVEDLYENPAARELVRRLAKGTTLHDPVLQTEGSQGFDVLNDAFSHVAGHLAITSFEREVWLFAMTCEDRQMVRRTSVRCFLIRKRDLRRFLDWDWCRDHVQVEKPWHWFRVVALHQIAQQWNAEKQKRLESGPERATRMPLVDPQDGHPRIREMSVGINTSEVSVGEPFRIPWESHAEELKKMGMDLELASGE